MQKARGFIGTLNSNGKYKYKAPESVVDFLVVGGGVVGLAIAQRLVTRFPTKSTVLVERHSRAGEETSSRNSEVIHSGLYYPPHSLKTSLCLRGRDMLYDRCIEHNIPFRKTGKLVVAKAEQRSYIEALHAKSLELKWPQCSDMNPSPTRPVLPTTLLSGDEARAMEPDLSNDIVAALWCPETGIIDSHSLMESLEKEIIDSEGGELVYSTRLVRVDPYIPSTKATGTPDVDAAETGWVAQTVTGDAEADALLARTLINAAGLSAPLIVNSLLPEDARIPTYYARGSYASYSGSGISNVSHLIYPCPETGPNAHAFQSLGTHLTLDLQGKVRFGPDIEWISPPKPQDGQSSEELADFWMRHLIPDDSIDHMSDMHRAVTSYLPGVTFEGMQPDYVGIRPKLVPHGFQDFLINHHFPKQRRPGRASPLISLLGVESPGLTSSLAIANFVVEGIESK